VLHEQSHVQRSNSRTDLIIMNRIQSVTCLITTVIPVLSLGCRPRQQDQPVTPGIAPETRPLERSKLDFRFVSPKSITADMASAALRLRMGPPESTFLLGVNGRPISAEALSRSIRSIDETPDEAAVYLILRPDRDEGSFPVSWIAGGMRIVESAFKASGPHTKPVVVFVVFDALADFLPPEDLQR
jgi:hypothetical protein